jgi:hypothetical protein
MYAPWIKLAFETARLGFEAQSVITLRLMRLAAGGHLARAEAERMISDKAAAMAEAQVAVAGALLAGRQSKVAAGKVVRIYGKRVRANKRRLRRK